LSLADVTEGNPKYVTIINANIQNQIKARGLGLLNPFKTIGAGPGFLPEA